jgi:hypothetical protein
MTILGQDTALKSWPKRFTTNSLKRLSKHPINPARKSGKDNAMKTFKFDEQFFTYNEIENGNLDDPAVLEFIETANIGDILFGLERIS